MGAAVFLYRLRQHFRVCDSGSVDEAHPDYGGALVASRAGVFTGYNSAAPDILAQHGTARHGIAQTQHIRG